ncbi:hypothetical protein [Hymenobacter sp.]|uniref:hypothetical protein n=1 Tax=Hymenobacter sp. TaxID=1898978 RepID=UPI00286AFA94|nr:hypothetical protein [Hymenobacter sp.]
MFSTLNSSQMPFYKVDFDGQEVHYLNLNQIVSVIVTKNTNDDMEANPYMVAVKTSNEKVLYDLTVKNEEFAQQLADVLMQTDKKNAGALSNA